MRVWQRVRSVLFVLGLLAATGALATFAWMTQNPASPHLERAAEWPVVGALVQKFRLAWLGEPPSEPVFDEELEQVAVTSTPPPRANDRPRLPVRSLPEPQARRWVDEAQVRNPEPPVLRPAAPDPPAPLTPVRKQIEALEWRWFLPGQPLHDRSGGGERLATLDGLSYLPVVRRESGWLEVLYDDQPGWLAEGWTPPHDRKAARQGGLRQRAEPYRGAGWERLDDAKRILGLKKPVGKLGAYELWTDVEDTELLTFLDQLAAAVEPAYFARYGRLPSGNPRRAAVLFAHEADYRRYSPERILSSSHVGHAGSGVLAMFVEGRPRIDLARTLAHEIVHLLNTRSLAMRLPQWLEEGLASDLGSVWVESAEVDGGGPLGRDLQVDSRRSFEVLGPDLRTLRLFATHRAGGLPDIGVFMTLPAEEFYRAENQGLAYQWGATFVRYLLDERAGQRPKFERFLAEIAHGYEPNVALFAKCFDISASEGMEALEAGFREWLERERQVAKLRIERRLGARILD